jgi:hypothetical protein
MRPVIALIGVQVLLSNHATKRRLELRTEFASIPGFVMRY